MVPQNNMPILRTYTETVNEHLSEFLSVLRKHMHILLTDNVKIAKGDVDVDCSVCSIVLIFYSI